MSLKGHEAAVSQAVWIAQWAAWDPVSPTVMTVRGTDQPHEAIYHQEKKKNWGTSHQKVLPWSWVLHLPCEQSWDPEHRMSTTFPGPQYLSTYCASWEEVKEKRPAYSVLGQKEELKITPLWVNINKNIRQTLAKTLWMWSQYQRWHQSKLKRCVTVLKGRAGWEEKTWSSTPWGGQSLRH